MLMKRSFVHQVLLQEAVRAATSSTEPTLDFIPDMAGVGGPMWTHKESQDPEESEKEVAKRDRTGGTRLNVRAGVRTAKAKLQVRRLTAGRALAAMHWTEEEKKIIADVKGKRNQGREKIRIMHNRSADEKGHHRTKRYDSDGKIWCEKCGKSAEVKRLTQWPTTKCRGQGKEDDQREDGEEGKKTKEERTRRERPEKRRKQQSKETKKASKQEREKLVKPEESQDIKKRKGRNSEERKKCQKRKQKNSSSNSSSKKAKVKDARRQTKEKTKKKTKEEKRTVKQKEKTEKNRRGEQKRKVKKKGNAKKKRRKG